MKNGEPIPIALNYSNVGRLPAFDLHEHYTFTVSDRMHVDNGDALATIEKTDICKDIAPQKDAEVLYPSIEGKVVSIPINSDGNPETVKIYKQFMSGPDQTLIMQMCIAYTTLGTTAHTAFCFYHDPNLSKGDSFVFCGKGNHAD